MTIAAPPKTVNNKAAKRVKTEAQVADETLDRIVQRLEKTPPDQFGRVLEREWVNALENLCLRGMLSPDWIEKRIRDGAGLRPNCQSAIDQFLARTLPAEESLVDVLAELECDDGNYRAEDAPDELIKRILPMEGVTMIGGQSGAGKTFFVIAMALAIATGKPFLGMRVREKGGVIIVAAEGAGTINSRLEAAKRHAGITGPLPIMVIRKPPVMHGDDDMIAFARKLHLVRVHMEERFRVRTRVAIIDTVSSAFAIKDENSNSEVAGICRMLAMMAKELGMAIVPVHHYGKAQEQGLRGASAWRANVDHAVSIIAERDSVTDEVTSRAVNIMKSRIGEEGPFCGMQLTNIPLGQNKYGEQVSSCAIEQTERAVKDPKPKRKQGEGDIAFVNAFNECCIHAQNEGRKRRIFGDGPIVPEVLLKSVRAEFNRRYAADGDDPTAALRQAWSRAKSNAIESRQYVTETDGQNRIYIHLAKAQKQGKLL